MWRVSFPRLLVTPASQPSDPFYFWQYDALDRIVKVTSFGLQSPVSSLFAYDARGNQRFVTDPLGNVTEYVYNERNWVEQQIEADPDGAGPLASPVTTFDYDCAGNLTSMTDPLDRTTTYSYDALNRLSTTTLPDPDGAGPLSSPVTSQTYDALGNVLTSTDALGNVTSYRYDAMSRLVEMTSSSLQPPVSSLFQYDLAGQLTSTTDPLGRTTSYAYDDLGRMVKVTQPDPDGAGPELAPWTAFTFDAMGNLLSETDRLGNTTTYGYDSLNRRTSETNANGETTQFAFDDVGNLVSLTDPEANETTWVYDALNRVIEETNELNATRYFEYDAVGNLIQKIDRNDRYTEYEYDNLHRLIEERWLDPTDDTTVIHTLNWTYDAASQLTEAADAFADYDYSYDALGRATSIAATLAGLTPAVTLAQQFDANSRRTQLTATIGSTADFQNDYTFDNLNRMTRITQQDVTGGNSVADKRVDLAYLADGQFDEINRYASLDTSEFVANSQYGYDGIGRLTSLSHAQGGTTFAGYAWAYDAANRITAFTNSQYSAEDATYSYDQASQLTGADRDGTANDEAYAFDDNGNRVTANGNSYTTGTNNRMTSDGTYNYSYDAEGNTILRTKISDGSYTEYTWDHRNQLTRITENDSGGTILKQIDYEYDIFYRRITKRIDNDGPGAGAAIVTHYVYDGENIALAVAADGDVRNRYLHGPLVDMVLADEQADDDLFWPLGDNQQTLRDAVRYDSGTDETTLANHRVFGSFGNLESETNAAVDILFGYIGRELGEESGLNYHRRRYVDPVTGSFLSEDPIADDSNNLHRYGANSPPNATDPNGLAKFWNPFSYGISDPGQSWWSFFNPLNSGIIDSGVEGVCAMDDGLNAWADGVIPFWDPNADAGAYDPSDPALQWSKFLGGVTRDATLLRLIPNLSQWAKNPFYYEVGSSTVSAEVWAEIEGLTVIERGAYLWARYGWGAFLLGVQAPGQFCKTLPKSGTPGGWIGVILLFDAADRAYEWWASGERHQ